MEIKIVKLIPFAALLSIVSAITVNLIEAGNPITSYTTGTRGRVELLSATICPEHIKSGNRPSMPRDIYTFLRELKNGYRGFIFFDAGHIISFQLGGPFERYNFYPQFSSYNRGVWARTEDLFVRYINTNGDCSNLEFDFDYGQQYPGIPERVNFRIDYSDGTSYSGHDDQTL